MPRTPEANQRIRETQRAKILESARSVFARKGMEATISDIAAEAQISLGLAYRYFADKEAILFELVKQTIPDDSVGFQKLVQRPGTAGERLATLISSIVGARGQREPLEAHQLLHHALDTGVMPEEIRKLLSKRYQILLSTMRQLIVEGQAEGSVAQGDPDQLVAVMSACLDGLTRWALRDPGPFHAYVPDAQIILRLFQPSTEETKASEQLSGGQQKRSLRGKGITYDTGFFHAGESTRESFDPEVVKREMRVIHDDLHCNAVRITGGNADRLEIAAIHAASAGLEVWFSPFTCDLTTDELLVFLVDCARRAERLRKLGAEVVFITGAELSLFTVGFLPGNTLEDRLGLLATPQRLRELLPQIALRLNDFLGKTVARIRELFSGKISYASIPSFENVDWTPFDFISVDAYRSSEIAERYPDAIRTLVAQGKPVAITEFGCTTFRGASNKSSWGGMIVVYENKRPVRLNGGYIRDEAEQATHLCELLDIFTAEGVDTAFVNTFVSYHLPHRLDPLLDLDMASYGVVKVLEDHPGNSYPDMAWEPKAAFTALAGYYQG